MYGKTTHFKFKFVLKIISVSLSLLLIAENVQAAVTAVTPAKEAPEFLAPKGMGETITDVEVQTARLYRLIYKYHFGQFDEEKKAALRAQINRIISGLGIRLTKPIDDLEKNLEYGTVVVPRLMQHDKVDCMLLRIAREKGFDVIHIEDSREETVMAAIKQNGWRKINLDDNNRLRRIRNLAIEITIGNITGLNLEEELQNFVGNVLLNVEKMHKVKLTEDDKIAALARDRNDPRINLEGITIVTIEEKHKRKGERPGFKVITNKGEPIEVSIDEGRTDTIPENAVIIENNFYRFIVKTGQQWVLLDMLFPLKTKKVKRKVSPYGISALPERTVTVEVPEQVQWVNRVHDVFHVFNAWIDIRHKDYVDGGTKEKALDAMRRQMKAEDKEWTDLPKYVAEKYGEEFAQKFFISSRSFAQVNRFGHGFARVTVNVGGEEKDFVAVKVQEVGDFVKVYLDEEMLMQVPQILSEQGIVEGEWKSIWREYIKPEWEKARFALVAKGTGKGHEFGAIGIVMEYPDGTFTMLTALPSDVDETAAIMFSRLASDFIVAEAGTSFTTELKGWEDVPSGAAIKAAFTSDAHEKGDWGSSIPVINQDLCKGQRCLSCMLCPEGVLNIDRKTRKITVMGDKCTSCEICRRVCPESGPDKSESAIRMVSKRDIKTAQASVFTGRFGKKVVVKGDLAAIEYKFITEMTDVQRTKRRFDIIYSCDTENKSLSGKRIMQAVYYPESHEEGERPFLYTFISEDGESWTKIVRPMTEILICGMSEYEKELAVKIQEDGFCISVVPSLAGDEYNNCSADFQKAELTRETDIIQAVEEAAGMAEIEDADEIPISSHNGPEAVVTAYYENVPREIVRTIEMKIGPFLAPFYHGFSKDRSLDEIVLDVQDKMPDFTETCEAEGWDITKIRGQKKDITGGHRACAGCPIHSTFNLAMQAVRELNSEEIEKSVDKILKKLPFAQGQHGETLKNQERRELRDMLKARLKQIKPHYEMEEVKEWTKSGENLLREINTLENNGQETELNNLYYSVIQLLVQITRTFDELIIINSGATGCAEVVTSIYPETSWRRYLHTVFGALGANLEGMNAAYRYLKKIGKFNRKVKFFGWGGDGGTYDIGLQSLSGYLERGLATDSVYFCYDNGAYMNTGIQRSSGTPGMAQTSTSPIGEIIRGKPQYRKDLAKFAAAHKNAYIATVSLSNQQDFIDKVRKAAQHDGPSLIIAYTNCRKGHGTPKDAAIEQAKLAVESGYWPLFEIVNGEYKVTYKPRFVHEFEQANKKIKESVHIDDKLSRQILETERDMWRHKVLSYEEDTDRKRQAAEAEFRRLSAKLAKLKKQFDPNKRSKQQLTEELERVELAYQEALKEGLMKWLKSEKRFAPHFEREGGWKDEISEGEFIKLYEELTVDWAYLHEKTRFRNEKDMLISVLLE